MRLNIEKEVVSEAFEKLLFFAANSTKNKRNIELSAFTLNLNISLSLVDGNVDLGQIIFSKHSTFL